MPETQKRQIAYKIKIKDLIEGRYIKEEGWTPNYLLTKNNQKISRVNLIGTIIGKLGGPTNDLILDDGTGKITLRIFEPDQKTANLAIGDTLLTIGKIREYNNTKYIVPEILKKITNPHWIALRKIELNKQKIKPEPLKKEEIKKTEDQTPYEIIIKLIKELDQGPGANIEEVIDVSRLENCEKLIDQLLKNGEIFAVEPGKLKILE